MLDVRMFQRRDELARISEAISNRERDVLERVMSGKLNKSIAKELSVSQRTVESARSRLMRKFGANTSAEMVRIATELEMLNLVAKNARYFCKSESDLEGTTDQPESAIPEAPLHRESLNGAFNKPYFDTVAKERKETN